MGRMTRKLSVVALVLLGAGVAAAQTSFMNGAGPSVNGIAQSTTTPTVVTAQTTVSPSGSAVAIDQIVSIARTVEAGAPASAFTVPSGVRLVVTDVIITNPGGTPNCGAAVMPGGAAASSTTGATTTGTTTAGGSTTTATSVESGTGTLCVPAQTTMSLGLTTGLEFTSGQSVALSNQSTTTASTTTATPTITTTTATPTTGATTSGATPTSAATGSGALHYHLRGFLVTGG